MMPFSDWRNMIAGSCMSCAAVFIIASVNLSPV
jgi:hypothetical protein